MRNLRSVIVGLGLMFAVFFLGLLVLDAINR
jgi:hypothetical protein